MLPQGGSGDDDDDDDNVANDTQSANGKARSGPSTCASEDKPVVLVACKLQDVGDVVPRVAVEGLLQPQLVEVVANEANGPAKHELAVEGAKGHEIVALLPREGSAGADHVDEGHREAPVNVEDQIGALPRGEQLHRQRKVQDWRAPDARP